jgi:regulator of sirC expression with transglutaminase-like and TPR domain
MLKNSTHVFAVAISIALSFWQVVNAQQAMSTSTGRVNGVTLELNGFGVIKADKIRKLINEGKYEKAAYRSISFIRSYETNQRSGIEKTDLVKEIYNNLCVSSAALRKVEYAMDACNRSLHFKPNHWESLKSRASLYFMTKEYQKALKDFKLSLENSPNDEISEVLRQNISVVQSKIN